MLAGYLPRACYLLADKAYDADHWRAWLLRQNIQPVIPNQENRKQPHAFDSKQYKDRNGIERMFGRLKDYRHIAKRNDKNANNFMACLCLAALILLLDLNESGPQLTEVCFFFCQFNPALPS